MIFTTLAFMQVAQAIGTRSTPNHFDRSDSGRTR